VAGEWGASETTIGSCSTLFTGILNVSVVFDELSSSLVTAAEAALAEATLLVRTVAVTTTVSVPWPWIGVIGFFLSIWPRLIEGRGEWGCAFAAGRRRVAVPCVFTERVLQSRDGVSLGNADETAVPAHEATLQHLHVRSGWAFSSGRG
jgi:hypothetical protein